MAGRRTNYTGEKRTREDWVDRFIDHYSETGQIDVSCEAAGICRNTFYKRRNEDPGFAERVKRAYEESLDQLEAVVLRRAKETSDTLAIFMLKAGRPERYRDRYEVRHGGEVSHHHTLDLSKLSDDQISQLEGLARAAAANPPADRG